MKKKHINIITAFITAALFLSASVAAAQETSEIQQEIEKAELLSNDIEGNRELAPFIPYDVYSDALIQLVYARNMLQSNQLVTALFYAKSSYISFKAALALAEAKRLKFDTVEIERDYFKSRTAGKETKPYYSDDKRIAPPSDAAPLIDANLHRINSAYRIQFSDRNLFHDKRFVLHDQGKNSLDKIIRVLKIYPKSSIKIVGHTSSYDYKGYSSRKAGVVADYLKNHDIGPERITRYGMSNREVTDTYYGFRRVDRVEVVITGIGEQQ